METEPQPVDISSDGTQKSEPAILPTIRTPTERAIGSTCIPDAIDRISQLSPRSLGGEIGAALISAATRHLSSELQETKDELRLSRKEVGELRGTLAQRDSKIAVQQVQLDNLSQGRHIRYLFISVGMALLGFAFDFFRNSLLGYGVGSTVMGLLILLGTWLTTPKGERQ